MRLGHPILLLKVPQIADGSDAQTVRSICAIALAHYLAINGCLLNLVSDSQI